MLSIRYMNSPGCRIEDIVNVEIDRSETAGNDKLFIVPEASKASVERMVFSKICEDGKSDIAVGDTTVTSGIVRYDVLSFVKFAQRIVQSSGDDSITQFDDILLRNVIYHIFMKHNSEFKNLNKYVRRFEYIDMLISLLGDFTRYGVTEDSLDEVLNNAAQSEVFYDKIADLKLLMRYISEINSEYEFSLLDSDIGRACEFISKAVKDPSLLKRRLYSYIKTLKKTDIVIYGFGSTRSFTPQELRFIKLLDELGVPVTVYVLYDPEDSENDLYYFGKNTLDTFAAQDILFELTGFEALPSKDTALYKVANAYAYDKHIKVAGDDSVSLLRMTDLDDELSFVCNEIINLTRKEGYRYKDIRVFSPDDDVTERFKGIMRLFGLDAFVDKRVILENTPVMRYVESILELPIYGYPIDIVLKLLRSGFVSIRPELIDYFENFCLRENITSGNRIFDHDRYLDESYSDDESGDEDAYYRPKFEIYVDGDYVKHGGAFLWKCVIEDRLMPIKEIADKIYSTEVMSQKAKLLLDHLDSHGRAVEYLRDEFLERNDTALASILVRSFTEMMTLLTSFTEPLNDVNISPDLFSSLISIDMRNKVLASIPLTVDSIEITDEDSACFTPCKVLFMIGCRSRNFPHRAQSDGIMTNNELIRLNSEISIDLPDKLRTKSREEFIRSALILNSASDKLIMINKDPDFKSEVFRFMADSFDPDIEKIVEFATPIYGLPTKKRHDFKDAQIDTEIMDVFLSDKSSTSVSSIENYSKCPLSFMLNGVLKIREREDGTRIQFSEIGTVAHAMFEKALRDVSESCKDFEELKRFRDKLDDESFMHDLSLSCFNEALSSSKLPDKMSYAYSLNPGLKVRRIFSKALPTVIDDCIENGYMPYSFEQKLKELDKKLVFDAGDGIKFAFNGSIDRIDKDPETGNIRIVDYKTGNKKVDMAKFASGTQIQLFAYALAMRKQDLKVDQVGYTQINLKPDTGKGDMTTFEYKPSELNEEQFGAALDAVEKYLQKCCRDIADGKATGLVNSELKSDACKYCTYRSMCGNNPKSVWYDRSNYEPEMDKKSYPKDEKDSYYIDKLSKRGES